MIIAIDFDQTYTADRNLWNHVIPMMQEFGHDVICVTCRAQWDVSGIDEIAEMIGKDGVFFTDNQPKIEFMEGKHHVDIWIDDCPVTVTGGGKVMYK